MQCIYPMIVDYQRDFLKDVEISLGKRTANSLFTKNGFCLFQCFPFVFDNNEIRYTLRGRLERFQHGLISRSTEVRVLLPHPSRKRTATYINDKHELILGHNKKCRKLCILTVISSEMILPYKRS